MKKGDGEFIKNDDKETLLIFLRNLKLLKEQEKLQKINKQNLQSKNEIEKFEKEIHIEQILSHLNDKMTDYDEEILEIAKDYDLEPEEAEEVQSLAEELGVDVDDAVMIHEAL